MKLAILTGAMVIATTTVALADCYGWRRASDFGRDESRWECGECLERGHYPAAGKMGVTFCTGETKQNGMTVYIAGNTVFADFDSPANAYCGCGNLVID